MIPVTLRATGIEFSILMDVNRNVEHIGVIVKGLLDTISYNRV